MHERLPVRLLLQVTLALVAAAAPLAAVAIELRGKVEEMRPYSSNPYPVGAARVELLDASGQHVLQAVYSGADGLYYLRSVGPGRYLLHINGRRYPLVVTPAPAGQNIPPIRTGR